MAAAAALQPGDRGAAPLAHSPRPPPPSLSLPALQLGEGEGRHRAVEVLQRRQIGVSSPPARVQRVVEAAAEPSGLATGQQGHQAFRLRGLARRGAHRLGHSLLWLSFPCSSSGFSSRRKGAQRVQEPPRHKDLGSRPRLTQRECSSAVHCAGPPVAASHRSSLAVFAAFSPGRPASAWTGPRGSRDDIGELGTPGIDTCRIQTLDSIGAEVLTH